jgi:hypothetical protein
VLIGLTQNKEFNSILIIYTFGYYKTQRFSRGSTKLGCLPTSTLELANLTWSLVQLLPPVAQVYH